MEKSRRDFLVQGAGMLGVAVATLAVKGPVALAASTTDCYIVNVCDTGAVGDGQTDDTAAIQQTINTYTMIEIPFMPAGFLISGPLQIPSDRQIYLQGTLLMASSFPAGHAALEIVGNISNVAVLGAGGIDGNAAPRLTSIAGIAVSGSSSTTITTQYVRISGITVANVPGSPCNIGGSVKDVIVSNATFLNVGEPAQIVGLATDCHFHGCTLDGSGDSGFSTWGNVSNSSFENCEASHCFASGIQVYNDGQNPYPSSDILIANNLVHDNQGWGIAVYSAASPPITNYDISIVGNHCARNGQAAGRAGNGGIIIWSGCGERIVVSANIVHHDGPGAIGILVNDGYATIVGNTVYDEGQGQNGSGTSIQIGGDHVLVASNQCFDDQTPPTTGQHLSISPGSYQALSIVDNSFSSNVPTIVNASEANRVSGNLGFNPQGKLSAPAVPVSGQSFVNPFATPVRVYVMGGTVTAIAVDGVVTGMTSGQILLGPEETIALSYGSAPTWEWLGL